MLVVPKSFSFAQIIYPSESRNQVAFSCGRRGTTVVVDEELDCAKDTSSVSLRLPPSPTGEGWVYAVATFVAAGQAPQVADNSASLQAQRMKCPYGGLCKPPARLVVMICSF